MNTHIIIAAAGEEPEVHTVVIDEKYIYHVKNGTKITITCTEPSYSLRWIPPQKISLSFSSTMKINNGQDNFIRIAEKKILFGMGTYSIDVCNSERDFMGLYSSEYDAVPWESNAVVCEANNTVGIVAYEDKVVIVTKDNHRKEIPYNRLMGISNQAFNTIFHYLDDPNGNYEKFDINLKDKNFNYIKNKISNIHGYKECIIGTVNPLKPSEFFTVIVYCDKLVIIQQDNERNEIEYKNMFAISEAIFTTKLIIYSWDNPGEGKKTYNAFLSDETINYINNEITRTQNAFKLINYDDKYYFKILNDNMLVYDKNGMCTELMFDKLRYVEKHGSNLNIYYREGDTKVSDEYPWDLSDDVLDYINKQIGSTQDNGGVRIFKSPTTEDVKIEFFSDKKEVRICNGNTASATYKFDEIISYEVKEFDNSSSLMSSSLLATGALAGGRNAITGALYAQQNNQKLSSIEIWITLKHNNEPILEQVDFVHPFFAFEKSSISYKEYQQDILKLTSYLDDIVNEKNQTEVNAASVIAESNAKEKSDAIAELREWNELLKEGIITEEEFAAKKKQLMGI